MEIAVILSAGLRDWIDFGVIVRPFLCLILLLFLRSLSIPCFLALVPIFLGALSAREAGKSGEGALGWK